jgi:glycosyltransferase involved in cell wall biosynthesis
MEQDEMVKVSVIIPAFNVERYVVEAIRSIQNQTLSDFEIVCTDDASTDQTLDCLIKCASSDERITIVQHEVNSGASKSRNDAIKLARGKYICFFDADDRLRPEALQKLYNLSEENRLDILAFEGESFIEDDFVKPVDFQKGIYTRKNNYNGIRRGIDLFSEFIKNGEQIGNLCFQFVRRDFFVDNNLFNNDDLRWYDDSPFSMYMAAKRVMCINDVLYERRYRNGSQMTSKITAVKIESLVLGVFDDYMVWGKKTYSDDTDPIVRRYFDNLFESIRMHCNRYKPNTIKKYEVLDKHPAARLFFERFILGDSRFKFLTAALVEEIKEEKELMIYGAGQIASQVMDYIESKGIKDYKVVVSQLDVENGSVRGRPIYEMDDLSIQWNKAVVIMAVSKKYREEIYAVLQNKSPKRVINIE